MTVVVGTAGHIDHGKTALLRALTGIDADRLPEERRRGMTIDVGYAHLSLPDGIELDFVDVPGHDRLVGNMLVGAGEIDAVMFVVAADDGPRAQTVEHLELLDALALRHGIAVVTKTDLVDPARVAEILDRVSQLLADTSLAGSPVVAVSSVRGDGMDTLRVALSELRDRVLASSAPAAGPTRLAIDRVFAAKGRGIVVTGSLRGGALARGATLRVVPGDVGHVRAREIQVHGRSVDSAEAGRTALNLAGAGATELRRGMVLTDDSAVVATDRLLVRLASPVPDRSRARVHLGTASVDGAVGWAGRDAIDLPDGATAATLRLAAPIAAAPGNRVLLRRPSGSDRAVGGIVLDAEPARGISRRRQSPARVGRLSEAIEGGDIHERWAARLDLHGALVGPGRRVQLAGDLAEATSNEMLAALAGHHDGGGVGSDAERSGLAALRSLGARVLRRRVTIGRDEAGEAAAELIDRLVAEGRLVRDGDRLRHAGTTAPESADADPGLVAAMIRLERALSMPMPPPLPEAARSADCPPAGIRELERAGRIVVLEDDLAYATTTYRGLEAQALDLAARSPLTPAMLRDATGTSRKYVMAILVDLDRRGLLRRIDAGHVPGPRAPARAR